LRSGFTAENDFVPRRSHPKSLHGIGLRIGIQKIKRIITQIHLNPGFILIHP
jgi:hypothetical protein